MFDLILINSSKNFFDKCEKLGFDNIFFMENFGDGKKADGVLIEAKTKEELIKKVDKARGRYKFIVVLGGNNEINRTALESNYADLLLNPERKKEKDFMHYRNSGLNNVLCKIAKEKGKAIGIDFSEIKKMRERKDAERLGRILQNMRLCRKYKVPVVIASFAKNSRELVHAAELKTFARTLGIDRINERYLNK